MQVTIARQLGLEPTTVGNFFMNARRRSMDKWRDEEPGKDGSTPGVPIGQQLPIIQQTNPPLLQDPGHGHEEL